jgi:cell division transport system permease protein
MLFQRQDHLGLRSAMADRLLPILVGAMSFLAALAIAGALAAASLADHWQNDTGAALTIQVPNPNDPAATGTATRLAAVLSVLQNDAGVANPHVLSTAELNDLLRPWLGADAAQLAVPVPAVITATLTGSGTADALRVELRKAAPGADAETGERWAARVAALTASIQASAAAILLIVAFVAGAVVSVATRAGLAQRRETIEIIHGLGALDGDIAARFAARATVLAAIGAASGTALALPVLFWLAALAAPFSTLAAARQLPSLPLSLWVCLPVLPVAAALIGWSTTQVTVRNWLRSLA